MQSATGVDHIQSILHSLACITIRHDGALPIFTAQCQVRHVLTDIIYLTKLTRLQLLLPVDEPDLLTDLFESAKQTARLWKDENLLTDDIVSAQTAFVDTVELAANVLGAIDEQTGSSYETEFLNLADKWTSAI
jgi:hypothetical protein